MKKLFAAAVFAGILAGSCAQKQEKREEFKAEHDKDYLRNKMGDSASAATPQTTAADSAKTK